MGPVTSRLTALAILAALLYGAWALVAAPVLSRLFAFDSAIAEAQTAIARHKRIIAMRETFAKRVEELSRQRILRDGFIRASSPELGIATLQGQVKKIVESGGGRLSSLRALAAEEENGNLRVGVRVVVSGDIAALADSFYRIESAWPVMFIDNVSIRARTRRMRSGSHELSADSRLAIQFNVYGFIDAPAAPSPKPGRKGGR